MPSCRSNGFLISSQIFSTINVNTSSIYFNNLAINSTGGYILYADIQSTNGDYNLQCFSNSIIVKNPTTAITLVNNQVPNIIFVFNASYQANLGILEHFKSMFYNCVFLQYNFTMTELIVVYQGSIGVATSGSGDAQSATELAQAITSGTFNFDGLSLQQAALFNNVVKSSASSASCRNSSCPTNSGIISFSVSISDFYVEEFFYV